MVIGWRIGVGDLAGLEVGGELDLSAFHKTDGSIELVAQFWVGTGEDVGEFMDERLGEFVRGLGDGVCGQNDGIGAGVGSVTVFFAIGLDELNGFRKGQGKGGESFLQGFESCGDFLLFRFSPREIVLANEVEEFRFTDLLGRLHAGRAIKRAQGADEVIPIGEDLATLLDGGESDGGVGSESEWCRRCRKNPKDEEGEGKEAVHGRVFSGF